MKKVKSSNTAKLVVQASLIALLGGLDCALPQHASAIGSGDADMMIKGFNNAFFCEQQLLQAID